MRSRAQPKTKLALVNQLQRALTFWIRKHAPQMPRRGFWFLQFWLLFSSSASALERSTSIRRSYCVSQVNCSSFDKDLKSDLDGEKGNGDGPANFTDYDISHDKHFTTYSHNNTLQHNTSQYDYQPDEGRPEPPKTRPPNDDDDSDDDGPLLKSPVNSQYHQNRRNESALRHSPSRGASPPKPR